MATVTTKLKKKLPLHQINNESLMIISNYVIATAFKGFRFTSIMYMKHCFSVCANSTLLDMD